MEHISSIVGVSHASPLPSTAWVLVDRRRVLLDGVAIQFELLEREVPDASGTPHRFTYARIRSSGGMKVLPSAGFVTGMSDAELGAQLRLTLHK